MTTSKDGRDRPAYLIRDRQQGKTTALVEWLNEAEALDDPRHGALMRFSRALLVRNRERKAYLMRSPQRALLYGKVFTIAEVAQARGFDFSRTEFALDDADDLILDSFPPAVASQIKVVAMTGDPGPTIVDALRWALSHSPEQIEARIATIEAERGDVPLFGLSGQIASTTA